MSASDAASEVEEQLDATAAGSGAEGMARDAVWSYAALGMTLASMFLITALGFRELPDRLMGIYSIATATTALMAVVDPAVSLGISRNVARLLAGKGDPDEERSFVATGHSVLVALGLGATVLAAVLGPLAHAVGLVSLPPGVWLMLALLGVSFAVQISTATWPAVLTGVRDFSGLAVAALVLSVSLLIIAAATLPTIGVAGLGIAHAGAMLLRSGYLWWRVRRMAPWASMVPARPTRRGVRILTVFALPMLLLSIAAQLMSWIDMLVLGSMAGAGIAALYRVGSLVPGQVVMLLYRAFDVAFPRLSAGEEDWQMRATALLTRVFSAGAAVCLAGLIAVRQEVVVVLTGERSPLAEAVLVIFAAAWAANVPAHGLGLLAIARGRQGAFIPIVFSEAAANTVLTVLLVRLWGPTGAAWATLVTLAVSNLAVLPYLLRRTMPGSLTLVIRDGLVPLVLAGVPAVLVFELCARPLEGVGRVAVVAVATCLLAVASALLAAGGVGRRMVVSSLRNGKVRHDPELA